MNNTQLVLRAVEYATRKHAGQVRKYTGEPYILHPIEVASLVATVRDHTPEMVAAAILHDVVEDTDATLMSVHSHFGPEVGDLVYWLTDVSRPEDGNRETRKRLDREHIAKAPPAAKTVKLADLISNSRTIVQCDPHFAKVYLREKARLLEVLKEGDTKLHGMASSFVDAGLRQTEVA